MAFSQKLFRGNVKWNENVKKIYRQLAMNEFFLRLEN